MDDEARIKKWTGKDGIAIRAEMRAAIQARLKAQDALAEAKTKTMEAMIAEDEARISWLKTIDDFEELIEGGG